MNRLIRGTVTPALLVAVFVVWVQLITVFVFVAAPNQPASRLCTECSPASSRWLCFRRSSGARQADQASRKAR